MADGRSSAHIVSMIQTLALRGTARTCSYAGSSIGIEKMNGRLSTPAIT